MRAKSVFEVAGVAAVTMVFTLVAFGPWNAGISDETRGIKPRILQPHFTSQGCQFGLKTGKPEYQAGESPVIELSAANPAGKAAQATVWVNVLAAEVPSPMLRTLAMPRPVWSKPWCVGLKPGETKTTRLVADVKLAANQNVSISMSDKQQSVLVKELAVRRGTAAKKAVAPSATRAPSAAK